MVVQPPVSFRSLLNQPVTLVHPASGPLGDDWGVAATRVDTFGRVDQAATVSETAGYPATDPDNAVAEWLLFLGPAETIAAGDRVEQGSKVFEVVGAPNPVNARSDVHHFEVRLRSVAGDGAAALVPPFSF